MWEWVGNLWAGSRRPSLNASQVSARIFAASEAQEKILRWRFDNEAFISTRTWYNGAKPMSVLAFWGEGDDELCVHVAYVNRESTPQHLRIEGVDQLWYGCGEYDNPDKAVPVRNLDRDIPESTGCAVLVVKGNECTVVCLRASTFRLMEGDEVKRFVCTVGSSAVPYGWVESELGIYAPEGINCGTGFMFWDEVEELEEAGDFYRGCWNHHQGRELPKSRDLSPKMSRTRRR